MNEAYAAAPAYIAEILRRPAHAHLFIKVIGVRFAPHLAPRASVLLSCSFCL